MMYLGKHYIIEFFQCSRQKLDQTQFIQSTLLHIAKICNATIIQSRFHHFSPFGVSGVIIIAESHMTIHTWPQYAYAAIDVFTCGSKMNNQRIVEQIKQYFKCLNYKITLVPRGNAQDLKKGQELTAGDAMFFNFNNQNFGEKESTILQKNWIYQQGIYSRMGINYSQKLVDINSPIQNVKIIQSISLGKILLCDNIFQLSQKTQKNYHQMMVHPSMQTYFNILGINPNQLCSQPFLNILIVGGGDGGTARQVLKYSHVKQIKIVQIDEVVVKVCKQHIPVTADSFKNQKVILEIGDGLKYVEQTNQQWDMIFCDGCDPIGQGKNLFARKFYQNCYKILTKDGFFVTQGQSYNAYVQQFKNTHKMLKEIFNNHAYVNLFNQPLYEGGMWAFQIGCKSDRDLQQMKKRRVQMKAVNEFVQKGKLQYYNYEIHCSCVALPTFVRRILDYG